MRVCAIDVIDVLSEVFEQVERLSEARLLRVVLSVSVSHLRLSIHLEARLLVESLAKLGLYLVEGSNAEGLLQVQLGLSFPLNMLLNLREGREMLPLLFLV